MTKLQVYAALEGTSTSASHACACSLQVLLLLLLLVPVLSSNEATRATEGIDATETALLNDVLTATLKTKQPCKMQTCTPVPLSTCANSARASRRIRTPSGAARLDKLMLCRYALTLLTALQLRSAQFQHPHSSCRTTTTTLRTSFVLQTPPALRPTKLVSPQSTSNSWQQR